MEISVDQEDKLAARIINRTSMPFSDNTPYVLGAFFFCFFFCFFFFFSVIKLYYNLFYKSFITSDLNIWSKCSCITRILFWVNSTEKSQASAYIYNIYIWKIVCAHLNTCRWMHARTHTHTHLYAHMYLHIYTLTCKHTHTHTHTHTLMCMPPHCTVREQQKSLHKMPASKCSSHQLGDAFVHSMVWLEKNCNLISCLHLQYATNCSYRATVGNKARLGITSGGNLFLFFCCKKQINMAELWEAKLSNKTVLLL